MGLKFNPVSVTYAFVWLSTSASITQIQTWSGLDMRFNLHIEIKIYALGIPEGDGNT